MGEAGVGIMAFPKFAGLETEIALSGQNSGQGGRSGDERMSFIALNALGGIVEADTVLVGILTCQQSGQTGPAQRGWDISIYEAGGPGRKCINERCLHHLMAHESEVGPGLIVGNDQHDIRAIFHRLRRIGHRQWSFWRGLVLSIPCKRSNHCGYKQISQNFQPMG